MNHLWYKLHIGGNCMKGKKIISSLIAATMLFTQSAVSVMAMGISEEGIHNVAESTYAVSKIWQVYEDASKLTSERTMKYIIGGENLVKNQTLVKVIANNSVVNDVNVKVVGEDEQQIVTIIFPERVEAVTYNVLFDESGSGYSYGNSKVVEVKGTGNVGEIPKPESNAEIYMFKSKSETALGSKGGEVEFVVYGRGLTEEISVKVEENEELKAVFTKKTDKTQSFKINFPENKSEELRKYSVKVTPKGMENSWFDTTIFATVAANKIEGAAVTELKAIPLGVSGLSYQLQFKGQYLSYDNIIIKTLPSEDVVVTDIFIDEYSGKAILTLPENKTSKAVTYEIQVGIKDNNEMVNSVKTLVIVMPLKDEDNRKEIDLKPTALYINTDRTVITMVFDQEVENATGSEAELKEKIKLTYGFNEKPLGKNDKIEFAGNEVIITLENKYEPLLGSKNIVVDKKALQTKNNELVKPLKWHIKDGPVVFSMDILTDEVLSSKGGEVRIQLNGYNLESANILGRVLNVGTCQINEEIKVQVEGTKETPFLVFQVPENTGDKTQCWLLKLSLNGTVVQEGLDYMNITKLSMVSVLPADKNVNDITLGNMKINSYGVLPDMFNPSYVETPINQESKKIQVHLYGTNLDAKKTKVRIIDEDGVEWPIYNIPAYDSIDHFIMVAMDGTGITGNGNHQLLEIICPRNIATDRIYKIQVAPDGENFESQYVEVKVVNKGESGLRKPVIKNVTFQYIDKNGNEIAPSEEYKGYEWFLLSAIKFPMKEIEGYRIDKVPEFKIEDETIGENDRVFQIIYEKLSEDGVGSKPDEGAKPDDGSGSKPSEAEKPGAGGNSGVTNDEALDKGQNINKLPQTGDLMSSLIEILGFGVLTAGIFLLRKKKIS